MRLLSIRVLVALAATCPQVLASQVLASQVLASEVSASEVSANEVSANEVSANEVSASEMPPLRPSDTIVSMDSALGRPKDVWTGYYAGMTFGYAINSLSTRSKTGATSPTSLAVSDVPSGGYAGVNYQINNFVLGAEADATIDFNDTSRSYNVLTTGDTGLLTAQEDIGGRLRLRAGYAVFSDILVFGAVGYSMETYKLTATGMSASIVGPVSQTHTFQGWNAGVGVDCNIMDNWLLRFEYVRDGFGKTSYNFSTDPRLDQVRASLSKNTVRAGFAYHF